MAGRSKKPEKKVTAAAASAAAAVVLVWVAGRFGLEVPDEVGDSVAVLAAFAGGYFKKS